MGTRPGERLHNYGESPFYSLENQLFRLGHFQVRKLLVYRRVDSRSQVESRKSLGLSMRQKFKGQHPLTTLLQRTDRGLPTQTWKPRHPRQLGRGKKSTYEMEHLLGFNGIQWDSMGFNGIEWDRMGYMMV